MTQHSEPQRSALTKSIAEVCADFKAEWSQNQTRSNVFLQDVTIDSTDRTELVAKVVQCEIELLRQDGVSPNRDEYLSRFPDIKPEIFDNLFFLPAPPPVVVNKPILPAGYKIGKQIGQGGIGSVWQVFDRKIERPLAAKVLLDKYRNNRDANRRLEREARLTGHLQHPGIPPIYDLGQLVSGSNFFVMKLIEGETFQQILETRVDCKKTTFDLLGIFEQIAQTLAYAHSQRIIHRDIKPQNIMVGKFGEVQIMDWGMAKSGVGQLPSQQQTHSTDKQNESSSFRAPASDALPPMLDTALKSTDSSLADPMQSATMAGDIVGTPAYMPPEQARGNISELGPQADVFALGAILFEILTGSRLHAGSNSSNLIQKAASGDLTTCLERLDSADADLSVKRICKDCLATAPRDRPANATIVAQSVAGYLTDVQKRIKKLELAQAQATIQFKEERKRRKLIALLATSIAAAAIIALTAMVWYQMDRARQQLKSDIERTNLLVQSITDVPAEAVPLAINELKPLAKHAVSILKERFASPSSTDHDRLRAAVSLAQLGAFDSFPFALQKIDQWPRGEANNLIRALQCLPSADLDSLVDAEFSAQWTELEQRERDNGNNITPPLIRRQRIRVARLAIAALFSGNTQFASQMLDTSSNDHSKRAAFIDTFVKWHGELGSLESIFEAPTAKNVNQDLRTGLLLSFAEVIQNPNNAERQTSMRIAADVSFKKFVEPTDMAVRPSDFFSTQFLKTLNARYLKAPDLAERNACEILIRRLGISLPNDKVDSYEKVEGKNWHVNSTGTTMRLISGGQWNWRFNVGATSAGPVHSTKITKPYYIADRPVTISQFQRFLDESDAISKTQRKRLTVFFASRSQQGDPDKVDRCPRYGLPWFHAVQYCNWLSQREGFDPSYHKSEVSVVSKRTTFPMWNLDPNSNGYRLPYSAELELAIRGETESFYSFGNDPQLLHRFGWFQLNSRMSLQPVATRLPNHWGIFDGHGNSADWCQDFFDRDAQNDDPSIDAMALVDPTGPESGQTKMLRPGHPSTRAVHLSSRVNAALEPGIHQFGFRIARPADNPDN